jgi:hypothetical protein
MMRVGHGLWLYRSAQQTCCLQSHEADALCRSHHITCLLPPSSCDWPHIPPAAAAPHTPLPLPLPLPLPQVILMADGLTLLDGSEVRSSQRSFLLQLNIKRMRAQLAAAQLQEEQGEQQMQQQQAQQYAQQYAQQAQHAQQQQAHQQAQEAQRAQQQQQPEHASAPPAASPSSTRLAAAEPGIAASAGAVGAGSITEAAAAAAALGSAASSCMTSSSKRFHAAGSLTDRKHYSQYPQLHQQHHHHGSHPLGYKPTGAGGFYAPAASGHQARSHSESQVLAVNHSSAAPWEPEGNEQQQYGVSGWETAQ